MKTVYAFLIGAVLGVAGGLYLSQPKVIPSQNIEISKETYTLNTPLIIYNKAEAIAKKLVPKSIAKQEEKQVLAADTDKDSSGTKTHSAVLDTKTGETQLVEIRPFAEWMKANEFSLGYSVGTIGTSYNLEYKRNFARIWEIYPTIQFNAWEWQSGERTGRTDLQVTGQITYKW